MNRSNISVVFPRTFLHQSSMCQFFTNYLFFKVKSFS